MMNYTLKSGLIASDFEFDGINNSDAHDFCDAFICDASVKENGEWRDATDDELDEINEDSSFVYESLLDYIY